MNWSKILRTFLPSLAFALMLFAPPAPVRVQGSTVVPMDRMNQTLNVHATKWLKGLLDKLPPRFAPRSQESKSYVPSSHNRPVVPQNMNTTIIREQQLDLPLLPPKTLLPKNFTSSFPAIPYHVVSESIEKNVLTFKFKPEAVGRSSSVTRINLWLFVWRKERKRKPPSSLSPSTRDLNKNKRRGRRRGKTIRIRVFLSDENGSRGQRLAMLKRKISHSDWEKLGLPVSLIKTLAETNSNNTLRLRVQCKRCSNRTQLILPGNNTNSKRCKRERRRMTSRKRKSKRRMRRWRCAQTGTGLEKNTLPFIVLE